MKNYPKWIGVREFISHLMEIFIFEYDISNDLRTVKSPLRICPIVAHSDYHGGSITRMTWNVSVDLVYSP